MPFTSSSELFSLLRYTNFCHDIFCHVGKRLDKKAEVNFEI